MAGPGGVYAKTLDRGEEKGPCDQKKGQCDETARDQMLTLASRGHVRGPLHAYSWISSMERHVHRRRTISPRSELGCDEESAEAFIC